MAFKPPFFLPWDTDQNFDIVGTGPVNPAAVGITPELAAEFGSTSEAREVGLRYAINPSNPESLASSQEAQHMYNRWLKNRNATRAEHEAYVAESKAAPGRKSTILGEGIYSPSASSMNTLLGAKPTDLRKTVLS